MRPVSPGAATTAPVATVAVVLVLAIDTSSAAVMAAVLDLTAGSSPVVLAQRRTVDARAHGELLAPSIRDCLQRAGGSAQDLAAIVAGLGPGPFTGLRVGLVTALAMADALGVPAYGVCSLDAIGLTAAQPGPLLVAGDARRREIYWARYVGGVRVDGPAVDRPADVASRADAVTGPMAGAGARLYADVLGRRLLDFDYPPPVALVALAAERITAAAAGEPLVPLYLRRPDAVAATSFKAVGR